MSEFATEVAVNVRPYTTPREVICGSFVVDSLTQTEFTTISDTSNCCEDCPDANPNPPKQSECPYFDGETQKWPVCTRDGNSDQVLNDVFFG